MRRWVRWGAWGLAALGLLALLGGLWRRLEAPGVVPPYPSSEPAGAGQGDRPGIRGEADPAPAIGLVPGRTLQWALGASLLDTGGEAAAVLPGTAAEWRFAPAEGVHLAAESAGRRTVPEAPGLVLLALAVLAGVRLRLGEPASPASARER